MSQYYILNANSKIIKIVENINPIDILDHEFLFYVNDDVNNSSSSLIESLKGGWIMRFNHSEGFDQKWKDCCKLYDQGKLTGIQAMGCSTDQKNPQSSDQTDDIILFLCGSTSDREQIMEYGRNLLKYIPYFSDNGLMTYGTYQNKFSKPTDCLYHILVPIPESADVNQFFLVSEDKRIIKINENKIPTEITDYEFLSFKNICIYNSFTDLDQKLWGNWKMFFKHTEGFDQKWKDCCKLYEEGKLTGIRELQCSTGFKNPKKKKIYHTTGEIIFFCSPAEDKLKMLEFGENLLKCIPYCKDSGFMCFCSNEPIEKDSKGKCIYQIPVPKNELSDVNVNLITLSDTKYLKIDENKVPSEILDSQTLSYKNMYIFNAFPEQEKLCGSWTMEFTFDHAEVEDIDQKWKYCCKLYDEGKLTGIRELRYSTVFKDYDHYDHELGLTTGKINFYCGPANDKLKIMEYGKNLLKLIPYYDYYDYFNFGRMIFENFDPDQDENEYFFYEIPVPKDESSDVLVDNWKIRSDNDKNFTGEKIFEYLRKNSEKFDKYETFIYSSQKYENLNISNSFPNCKLMGSWMMFFEHSDLDQKWKVCGKLYDEGKLFGIQWLKFSKDYKSVKRDEHGKSVIFFFCGPSNDKPKMLEIGRNLLKSVPYYSNSGHMIYKTNEEDYQRTKATDVNPLYRISVPINESSDIEINQIFLLSKKKKLKINENKIPTEILDFEFVNYSNSPIYDEIYNSLSYELRKLFGSWRMYFKHAEGFNQKWKECCKLYDEGKLTGIQRLLCSTGCRNSILTDPTMGVIFFYSGPGNDRSKMLEYGENLLKYIPYYNGSGFMEYGLTKFLNDISYKIPVPKDDLK